VTIYFNQFQSSASGPTTLINLILAVSGGVSFEAGVYSDNGSNAPGTVISETGPQMLDPYSGGYNEAPVSSPATLTPSTAYWLAFMTDGSYYYNMTASTLTAYESIGSFGSFPSSAGPVASGPVSEFTIYGTTCP
jgi:hypothetical protein